MATNYQKFEAIVGKEGVVKRKEELLTYECDGLASYRQRPAVVVLPRTTRTNSRNSKNLWIKIKFLGLLEVQEQVYLGGALPVEDCVLIVTARMRKILDIDLKINILWYNQELLIIG